MVFTDDDAVEIASATKDAQDFAKKHHGCYWNVQKMETQEAEVWVKAHPPIMAAANPVFWIAEVEAFNQEKLVFIVSADTKQVVYSEIEFMEPEEGEEEDFEEEMEENEEEGESSPHLKDHFPLLLEETLPEEALKLSETMSDGKFICFFCKKQFSPSQNHPSESNAIQLFFVQCGICRKIACESCGQFCPTCQQWICKEDWDVAAQVCNRCAPTEEKKDPLKIYEYRGPGTSEIQILARRRFRIGLREIFELTYSIGLVIVLIVLIVLYLIYTSF